MDLLRFQARCCWAEKVAANRSIDLTSQRQAVEVRSFPTVWEARAPTLVESVDHWAAVEAATAAMSKAGIAVWAALHRFGLPSRRLLGPNRVMSRLPIRLKRPALRRRSLDMQPCALRLLIERRDWRTARVETGYRARLVDHFAIARVLRLAAVQHFDASRAT